MLCLIMTLPLYSQKALSDTCRVPCAALKKALVVREERIYCGTQLGFARDTISNLQEIILSKDTIILHRDSAIILFKDNENKYKEVITNKDSIIITYGKEIGKLKAAKTGAYIVTGLTILLSIFFGL
jgi:hypothetical protein